MNLQAGTRLGPYEIVAPIGAGGRERPRAPDGQLRRISGRKRDRQRSGRDMRAISGAPSHDVFLVKVSYWLPL